MRKDARLAHPQKSALTTEVVASEAVGAAEASSVMTTEVLLEATEEAFRTGEEVAVEVVVEEATTEEVSHLLRQSYIPRPGCGGGGTVRSQYSITSGTFPLPSLPTTLLPKPLAHLHTTVLSLCWSSLTDHMLL